MSHRINLETYLEQHRTEGESQGTGDFTVEHQKAARKMARFALPRRTAWVCKLVQAAVGWKINQLTINQGKTYTVFHFDWPNPTDLPTEKDIVGTMVSGMLGDSSALASLCTGLRAAVEQADLSFLLVLRDDEINPKPIYAGIYFSELSESARLSPAFGHRLGMTITIAHLPATEPYKNAKARRYHQAAVTQELDAYCFMSPVPIVLDGRRIDGPINSSLFAGTESFRPLFTGGTPTDDGRLFHLPEGFQERRMSVYTHPRRARRDYNGEEDFRAALLLGCKLYGSRSRQCVLNWVRQGVVVDSTTLDLTTSVLTCDLYLNGDGLDTDLTGFKIALRDETQELQQDEVRRLGRLLKELPLLDFAFAPDRDEFSGKDDEVVAQEVAMGRMKRVLKGGGTGICLALFSPVLGTIVSLGTVAKTYLGATIDRNSGFQKRDQVLRRLLAEDLTVLAETLSDYSSA